MYRRQRLRHIHDNGLMPNHNIDFEFDPEHVEAMKTCEHDAGADILESAYSDEDIEDPVADDEIERTSTISDESACDHNGTLDPIEGASLHSVDDPRSSLNPLTRFLFKFATKFALSDKAMTSLMQGLLSIDCTGDYFVPKDFRTIHNAITRSESASNMDGGDLGDDDTLTSTATGVSILFICSKCNCHEFEIDVINSKKPCGQCGVVSVRCGFQRCKADWVATSLLGKRSIYQLTVCSTCKAGPTSEHTVRLYFFNLDNHVQNLFSNKTACLNAMAPFTLHNDKHPLWFHLEKSDKVIVTENWYDLWIEHLEALKYKSETWHGERFQKHPIWKEHGIRSLLLSMFIDWFPPFKKKGYSLGIVSCSVLNMSCEARGSGFSVWPLAILEGPTQMHSTYVPLRKLCQTFESFYNNGIRVHDALTNSFQTIHGVVAQVIGDSPALAKIGMHNSHSSYFGCHRCGHKGVVCGCDSDRPAPSRYDNVNFHPRTMFELDRVTLTGQHRTASKTEHIVWLEAELITKCNLRMDSTIKADEFKIWSKLNDKRTRSWSNHRMTKWLSKLRVKGLSPLVHIPHLSLVDDLPTEAMHFLIKGILLQLAEYTFSDRKKFKNLPSNINRSSALVNTFLERMQRFTLPSGTDAQHGLSTHVHFAKAEPLYSFLKVQALLALEGLVNPRTFEIWRLMSVVVCALLHTHNPKWWFENELSKSVRDLVNTFMAEFGECAMRPSWHYLLHCKIDYDNWSTARSHWAFPGERLCGHLLRQVRNASFARITQSIVRMSHRAMRSLQFDNEDADLLHHPARRLRNVPLLPDALNSQMQPLLKKGYSSLEKGVGFHNSIWKVGDYAWLCDYDSDNIESRDQRLFKVVAILGFIDRRPSVTIGDIIVLQRLDLIRPRAGYHNVFQWAPLDPLQPNGVLLDTSSPKPSVHMCGVAAYASLQAGDLLIPVCGNLPF